MQRLIISVLLALVSLSSCVELVEGEGDVITREYNLKDFKGVALDIPGKLVVTQGDKYISVTTNKNLFEWLNLYVTDSILHIYLQDKVNVWRFDELKFEVSLPNPVSVELDGSGDIVVPDSIIVNKGIEFNIDGAGDVVIRKLKAASVRFKVNGSGNIRCDDLQSETVYSDVEGTGDVKLTGKTDLYKVSIDGTGSVYSFGMSSENAIVQIDGSGDCQLNVLETLDVDIDGTGSVYYKGNPETNISIDGAGSVNHVGE